MSESIVVVPAILRFPETLILETESGPEIVEDPVIIKVPLRSVRPLATKELVLIVPAVLMFPLVVFDVTIRSPPISDDPKITTPLLTLKLLV